MFNLPKNIYVIGVVISLNFASMSMMVLVGGLVGANIAPSQGLATLPIAFMVASTALATIPAAMIMQRLGRKKGLIVGLLISLVGTFLAFMAVRESNFSVFMLACCLLGFNAAFVQQSRFIVLENAQNKQQEADGLTLSLMANLFGAVVGPWIGAAGVSLINPVSSYAGSFVLSGALLTLALLILLTQFKDLPISEAEQHSSSSSLLSLLSNPIFIIAAGSSAIGFGVMTLIMTATPISMHEMGAHSLEHTTFVIQSHIVAMFLPSIITGSLLKRGYQLSLIFAGLSIYLVVSTVALLGISVMHYWWALVLLGIGWNFLFLISTAILPLAYSRGDKFKAQAANDFIVFTFQALAAFAAGWLLFSISWQGVAWVGAILSLSWLLVVVLLAKSFKLTGS